LSKARCLPVATRRLPCRTVLDTCVQRRRSAPFISANVIEKLTHTLLSHAWYVARNASTFPNQVSVRNRCPILIIPDCVDYTQWTSLHASRRHAQRSSCSYRRTNW